MIFKSDKILLRDRKFKMNRDVLNLICTYLTYRDMVNLKLTCKLYNDQIKLITIRSYFAIMSDGFPIEGQNCLKFRISHNEYLYEKLIQEIHSKELQLLAAIMYGNLRSEDDGEIQFLQTSTVRQKKLEYGTRLLQLKINITLELPILNYILKEIRHIQKHAWQCPYSHTTTLVVLDEKLILTCVEGEIFEKTHDVLLNLIRIFQQKSDLILFSDLEYKRDGISE